MAEQELMEPNSMTLIERIEHAKAPSRELDLEIAKAVGLCRTPQEGSTQVHFGQWWPHYSASLDTAMSLVPARATYVRMEICARGTLKQHCLASIQWEATGDEWCHDGDGKTMPLAICAAALRALAAERMK